MDNAPFRYRLTFSKTTTLRFISHLDLHRALERTFRRAGLPLAYSQGYRPKPRISIGAALPLGMTSSCELADFWLEREMSEEDLYPALEEHSPPGLLVQSIHKVDPGEPALQTRIEAAEYLVTPMEPIEENISERVTALLDRTQIIRQRRGKTYDLRPLILAIWADIQDKPGSIIRMRLSAREGRTGRPEEVCLELGLDPALCSVQRVGLIFEQGMLSETAHLDGNSGC